VVWQNLFACLPNTFMPGRCSPQIRSGGIANARLSNESLPLGKSQPQHSGEAGEGASARDDIVEYLGIVPHCRW
jgi:hypothetical protein